MKTINNLQLIIPRWPIPDSVKSIVTTRKNGFSQPPYDSFNLASHVNDNLAHVQQNRDKLNQLLATPAKWLNQIHSLNIIEFDEFNHISNKNKIIDADGVYSLKRNQVCSILTADCLPILFCSKDGSAIAAIHAGWKGLAMGIINQAIKTLSATSKLPAEQFLVWLGPAISKQHFEVGLDVKLQFINNNPAYKTAFTKKLNQPTKENKYLADIYQLARINLQQLGVTAIYGGDFCTYADPQRFFSYRRDGFTGRMAALIWKI
ncbi:MAG: peptidoglycan editing factor PgeF [Pseudomonadota bacterium]